MTNFAENENHQVIVADNADIGLPVHWHKRVNRYFHNYIHPVV